MIVIRELQSGVSVAIVNDGGDSLAEEAPPEMAMDIGIAMLAGACAVLIKRGLSDGAFESLLAEALERVTQKLETQS